MRREPNRGRRRERRHGPCRPLCRTAKDAGRSRRPDPLGRQGRHGPGRVPTPGPAEGPGRTGRAGRGRGCEPLLSPLHRHRRRHGAALRADGPDPAVEPVPQRRRAPAGAARLRGGAAQSGPVHPDRLPAIAPAAVRRGRGGCAGLHRIADGRRRLLLVRDQHRLRQAGVGDGPDHRGRGQSAHAARVRRLHRPCLQGVRHRRARRPPAGHAQGRAPAGRPGHRPDHRRSGRGRGDAADGDRGPAQRRLRRPEGPPRPGRPYRDVDARPGRADAGRGG